MLRVRESSRRKLSRGFCVWMRIDSGAGGGQTRNGLEAGVVTWI